MLPQTLITDLEAALDATRAPEVPGAAVAILSPNGDWFGASGVSNVAENTPLQPDDRFEAGSITKTFIATAILQLVEEGQLTLEDTLTDWLPADITALVPNAGDITMRQLLNHTSGIADYFDQFVIQASSNPTLFLQEWQPEQLIGFLEGVEPLFEPGASWQYSNTNYILAGSIIEAVTGNNYGSELRSRIIDPLNLENTFISGEEEIPGGYIKGYWDFDNNGTLDDLSITNLSWAGSAGSLISNTEDLATFFDALLKDRTLLQPETLAQMLETIPVNLPNYNSYGLGIGTLESPTRFWYAHRGQTLGFRSSLWYSPAEDITYVELTNGRSTDNLAADLLPTFRNGLENNNGGNPIMNPEIEFDIVGTDAAEVLMADIEGSNIDGLGGNDIIMGNVRNDVLVGGDGDDIVRGSDGNDIGFGSDGDDNLNGDAGDDIVSGDEGNDSVTGGSGNDILMGVTGIDILTGDSLSKGGGSDLFVYGNGDGTDIILDFEVGTDQIGLVEGELAFDDLSMMPNDSNAMITVDSSGEVLAILVGVESAALDESSFVVVPDVSNPAEALVLIDDGTGDSIVFDRLGTDGPDVLVAEETGSNIEGFSGNDILSGAGANDILSGSEGDDVLRGGDGNDITFGGADHDNVDGQAGDDIVSGDAGDDIVAGGSGDDILMGVTGNDALFGDSLGEGGGTDVFVYGNGDGTDIIFDFEVGIDQIGLVEGELTFADLNLMQKNNDTEVAVAGTGEVLAVLNGVEASALDESSFVIVPDVSNPEEALALIENGNGTTAPVVSLSTNATTLIESENTVITFDFEVDGDIPEGGLPVSLDIDAPDLLWITDFFNFSRTGRDAETGLFNSIFILPNPEGLGGEISDFSGSLLVRDVLEPFDSIPLILEDNNASFELVVFDDPFAEENETVEFSIGEGEGYTVSSDPVTVTIQDSPDGIVNPSDVPVIGVSVTAPEVLVEDDPDNNTFTLNFDIEGKIPDAGIDIAVESDTLDVLPDFDISIEIIRDDEGAFLGIFLNDTSTTGFSNEITIDGVTSSLDLLPIEFGRGFDGTIVDATATFTLNVRNDSVEEGLETLNFSLIDGEAYDVAPDAGTVSLTIADPPEQPPIVGTDADDKLEGTVRNDTVAGELGADIIMGGDGNDILRGDRNNRSPQDDVIGGNDIIFGGDGNDRIGGKSGNDILSGDAGDDLIWGDDGDDILMGVTGNDILVGDNFSGGSGSDLFVFGLGDGTDTVLDFEVGTDRIGIVEGEFTFADVMLTQDGANTLLGVGSETLAVLNNVMASALDEISFEVVPDVSNPEEALALV